MLSRELQMRTVLIVVVMSACFAEEIHGQSEPDSTLGRNQIFIELLGNGVFYSINYERRLGEAVALRAGYTRWTELCLMECSGLDVVTAVPVIVSALVRPRRHTVELGLGVLGGRQQRARGPGVQRTFVAPTAVIALRYGGGRTPFVGRLGVMPTLYPVEMVNGVQYLFVPIPGVSIGMVF